MKRNGSEEKILDKADKYVGQFNEKYDDLKDTVKAKADDVLENADKYVSKGMAGAEAVRDSLSQLTERITHNVESAVNKGLKQAKNVSANTEQLVKKYPLYTIAGAAAVSFIAGMIYGKVSKRD